MTDLSPQAQAVYEAFIRSPMVLNHQQDDFNAIAAALRAAALYCKQDRLILLSLADELEGADGPS